MAHGQPVLAGLQPFARCGPCIYLPASGEVGQAIKLVIGGPANLTAHLTTVSQPGVPSVEQPSTSPPRRGVKVAS